MLLNKHEIAARNEGCLTVTGQLKNTFTCVAWSRTYTSKCAARRNRKGPKSLVFDYTPQEMVELTDDLLERGANMVNELVSIPKADKTFENTMLPLARFESEFSTLKNNIEFIRYVSPDKARRDQSVALEEKYVAFSTKMYMRVDFYEALTEFRDNA